MISASSVAVRSGLRAVPGLTIGAATSELSQIIALLRSVGGSLYLPGPTNRVAADGSGVSALAGDVVGYVPDLVGSGTALTQATTANKPTLKRVPILGNNLIQSFDFRTWAAINVPTNVTQSSWEMASGGGGVRLNGALTPGKQYSVTITFTTTSTALALFADLSKGNVVSDVPVTVTSDGTGFFYLRASSAGVTTVTSINVREIIGYRDVYTLGFDGLNDSIAGTARVAPTLAGDYTLICACAATSLGTRKIVGDNARSLEINPSGSISVTHRGTASVSGGLVAAGERFIAAVRYTGGGLLLQKNGVTLAQSLVGAPTTAATVFTVGNRGNSSDWWLGDFYGAIRVPSAITDAQLAKLTAYLAKLAGVTL